MTHIVNTPVGAVEAVNLINTDAKPDPFQPQRGDVYEFGAPFPQRLVVEDPPTAEDPRIRYRVDGGCDSNLTSLDRFHLHLAGLSGLKGLGRVREFQPLEPGDVDRLVHALRVTALGADRVAVELMRGAAAIIVDLAQVKNKSVHKMAVVHGPNEASCMGCEGEQFDGSICDTCGDHVEIARDADGTCRRVCHSPEQILGFSLADPDSPESRLRAELKEFVPAGDEYTNDLRAAVGLANDRGARLNELCPPGWRVQVVGETVAVFPPGSVATSYTFRDDPDERIVAEIWRWYSQSAGPAANVDASARLSDLSARCPPGCRLQPDGSSVVVTLPGQDAPSLRLYQGQDASEIWRHHTKHLEDLADQQGLRIAALVAEREEVVEANRRATSLLHDLSVRFSNLVDAVAEPGHPERSSDEYLVRVASNARADAQSLRAIMGISPAANRDEVHEHVRWYAERMRRERDTPAILDILWTAIIAATHSPDLERDLINAATVAARLEALCGASLRGATSPEPASDIFCTGSITVVSARDRRIIRGQRWTSPRPDFRATDVSFHDDDPRLESDLEFGARDGTWTWRGSMHSSNPSTGHKPRQWQGTWAEESK